MPRQEDELQSGREEFFLQQQDEDADLVEYIFRNRELNNMKFIWSGEPVDPGTEETLVRAFELAGRGDVPTIISPILAKADLTLIEEFFISDDRTDNPYGDSRSVDIKYGDDCRLRPGRIYFIHQT